MTPSLADYLAPTVAERVGRAQSDLRLGLPVLVTHLDKGALAMAVESLTEDRLRQLSGLFGEPELVLTANRARAVLGAQNATQIGTAPVRIQPPALAKADWFRQLADTGVDHAGPTGPLHLLRSGDTELHDVVLTLVKSTRLLPAAIVFPIDAVAVSPVALDVPHIALTEAQVHFAMSPKLAPVAGARFPIEVHENGRLQVFRDPDGVTEHYALEVGSRDRSAPVLCRVHSACFTGDVLGSLKCDCGPQLRRALDCMGEEGSGVLLYLNQEGRGIGLANKMRVYDLQAKGFDTVEANHRLGFADDERDFRVAAVMLRALGVESIRLLTNNPRKVDTLRRHGVDVAGRLPLRVGENPHNRAYLSVKALKSGHAL